MADAFPIVPPRFRALDQNGDPLAGGKLYAYAAGTTTPQDTFTTRAANVANANPVILDANGEADVWLTPAIEYKFVLKDSTGVTQWTVDDYPSTQDLTLLPNGSVTAPAMAFASDTNTGVYRPAVDQLGIAAGGALAGLFTASQFQARDGTVGAPGIAFQSDPDTGLWRNGADDLGLGVGGVQVLRFNPTGVSSNIPLSGANPTAATGFSNTVTPSGIPKAWARIQTSGAGAYTVIDGFNVSGVASSGTDRLEITLATGIADTAKAIVLAADLQSPAITKVCIYAGIFTAPTTCRITAVELNTVGPAAAVVNFATSVRNIAVVIFGAQ